MTHIGPVTTCQICKSARLQVVLSLGHQPIVQEYLTSTQLHQPEATYPLTMVRCVRCGLLQLDYIVEPSKVFPPQYPYRTGLTNMLIRNFEELSKGLLASGYYHTNDLVVDIGSNDGTLLKPFKQRGARVVGVEPTNAAKVANKSGIPTLQEFFSGQSVKKILKKYGKAKVITATNVFAHINDTALLVKNIKALMDNNSVFVSESQYVMDIIEKLEFDTIYHEHLRFYALKPLTYLFKEHGLSIVDAERITAAGGSIRVYAKKGAYAMSQRAKTLLKEEEKAGLYDTKKLKTFADKVHTVKNELLSLLLRLKKDGANVAALTSPARANPMLNFVHIDNTIIVYAGEKNGSPKIGLYTPGTHILVVDEAKILKDQPDYVLVLSWHIGTELMKKVRSMGYKGKFIIPLPTPHVANI
jgi:2-polyprenyl-3-methyl-5-hydroxy-6-metoxy-1,4-benzoquinol methylase